MEASFFPPRFKFPVTGGLDFVIEFHGKPGIIYYGDDKFWDTNKTKKEGKMATNNLAALILALEDLDNELESASDSLSRLEDEISDKQEEVSDARSKVQTVLDTLSDLDGFEVSFYAHDYSFEVSF